MKDAEQSAETQVMLDTKVTGLSGVTLRERTRELMNGSAVLSPAPARVAVAAFNASL